MNIPVNLYKQFSLEQSEKRISVSKDRSEYVNNRMNTNYEIKNIKLQKEIQAQISKNVKDCQHTVGKFQKGTKEAVREEQKK